VNSNNWKELAELVGLLAIVGSLIFVGLQLQQEQAIANAELQNEMISIRAEVNALVIENADVLVKSNSGQSLTEEEEIILFRLVESYWGVGFFGFRRWQFVDHPAVEAPMRDFALFLHRNDGARRLWEAKPGTLIPREGPQEEFVGLVKARLEFLDSQGE
jgi:hypothetical protein